MYNALVNYKEEHGTLKKTFDPMLCSCIAEALVQRLGLYQHVSVLKEAHIFFSTLNGATPSLGHVNVLLRDKDYPKLGKWVSHQRFGCVRADRRIKLDQLGFLWDASSLTSKRRKLDESERAKAEIAEKNLANAVAIRDPKTSRRSSREKRKYHQIEIES